MMKILFLCTGNSCRSQMAEGWAKFLKQDIFQSFSAGVAKSRLDPLAVKVMREAGVDISNQSSKLVDQFLDFTFDYVITVCDNARENCPVFNQTVKTVHLDFDDPPKLALESKSEEEALGHYRRVRDEIKAFVESLPESLNKEN